MSTPRTPPPRRGAATGSGARPTPVSDLLRATVVAIRRLEVARALAPDARRVECRAVDRMLRSAVDRHPVSYEGGVSGRSALRVACAHLVIGDLEDAYYALLTARDVLR